MFRYIDYQCPDCDSILKEFDDETCYCPKCKKEIPKEEAMKNIIYY